MTGTVAVPPELRVRTKTRTRSSDSVPLYYRVCPFSSFWEFLNLNKTKQNKKGNYYYNSINSGYI